MPWPSWKNAVRPKQMAEVNRERRRALIPLHPSSVIRIRKKGHVIGIDRRAEPDHGLENWQRQISRRFPDAKIHRTYFPRRTPTLLVVVPGVVVSFSLTRALSPLVYANRHASLYTRVSVWPFSIVRLHVCIQRGGASAAAARR